MPSDLRWTQNLWNSSRRRATEHEELDANICNSRLVAYLKLDLLYYSLIELDDDESGRPASLTETPRAVYVSYFRHWHAWTADGGATADPTYGDLATTLILVLLIARAMVTIDLDMFGRWQAYGRWLTGALI